MLEITREATALVTGARDGASAARRAADASISTISRLDSTQAATETDLQKTFFLDFDKKASSRKEIRDLKKEAKEEAKTLDRAEAAYDRAAKAAEKAEQEAAKALAEADKVSDAARKFRRRGLDGAAVLKRRQQGGEAACGEGTMRGGEGERDPAVLFFKVPTYGLLTSHSHSSAIMLASMLAAACDNAAGTHTLEAQLACAPGRRIHARALRASAKSADGWNSDASLTGLTENPVCPVLDPLVAPCLVHPPTQLVIALLRRFWASTEGRKRLRRTAPLRGRHPRRTARCRR